MLSEHEDLSPQQSGDWQVLSLCWKLGDDRRNAKTLNDSIKETGKYFIDEQMIGVDLP